MKTVTKIFAIVLVLGLVFGFSLAGDVKAADEDPVCNTNSGLCYTTIQAAITAAASGDTIYIENGTYPESLDIYKSLTLNGESEAGVIIDAIGSTSYGIDASGDYTTYFSNFTLNNAGTYGLKIAGENAYTHINHVTVNDSGRSGIDLNGVAGGTINDVTITDSVYGVGLALTDTSNVAVSNVTTSGNAWGGMAIYVAGNYDYTGGSSNISLTGTNSFAEAQDFYIQEENGYEVTGFTQTDFSFTVVNETDAPGYILFYETQAEATAVALGMTNPVDSVITDLTSDTFLVVPGLSIQAAHDAAAPGDTIIVADGTYTYLTEGITLPTLPDLQHGLINIYKQITIKAADDGNTTRPVIDASLVDGVFKIHANALSGGEIVIEGFDITGDKATTGKAITTMFCGGEPATKIIIRDNLIHGMLGGFEAWGSSSFCPDGTDYKIYGIEITDNDFYDLGVTGIERGFGVVLQSLSDWTEAGNAYAAVLSGNTFNNIYTKSAELTELGVGIAFLGGSANSSVFENSFSGDISVDIAMQAADVTTTDLNKNDLSSGVYGVAAVSTTGGSVDASPNWWGQATGPTAAQMMGSVDYIPWCLDAACTTFGYPPVHNVTQGTYFATIQAAIDDAATVDGDVIEVAPGTYAEAVVINKPNLTIESTGGASSTIIDVPFGSLTTGINIVGTNLGVITFDGFTVKNFTSSGIVQAMASATGTTLHVLNNIVIPYADYMRNGIQVSGDGSTVVGNIVTSAPLTEDWAGTAINVANASNVLVKNNTITGSADIGIAVMNYSTTLVSGVLIEGNTVSGVSSAVGIQGGPDLTGKIVSDITIKSNNFTGAAVGVDLSYVTLAGTNVIEMNQLPVSDYYMAIWVEGYPDWGYPGAIVSGTIDFSPNWFGSSAGPDLDMFYDDNLTDSFTLTGTTYAPWCTVADCSEVYGPVKNENRGTFFGTIQAAIDDEATLDGDVITVAAGTYDDGYIYIYKAVELRGPNYGIAGTAARNPEAVIVGPGDDWLTVYVDVDGVSIDGFKFDGQYLDPGEYYTVGIYGDLSEDLTVQNNVFTDHEGMAVITSGGYSSYISGVTIKDNLITNTSLYDSGYNFGLYLQSTLGNVTGNVVTNVRSGIQIQPYSAPGAGLVQDNEFSVYGTGMYFNYTQDPTANWTFSNNTVTGIPIPVGSTVSGFNGIRVQTFYAGNVTFTDNTINIGAANAPVIYPFRKINHTGGTIDLEATLDNNTWEKVVVVRDSLGDIKETTLVTPALNGDATFFSTIQSAIDDVYTVAGDTVDVGAGTYTEQVIVNKSISLVGTGSPVITPPATVVAYKYPETGKWWEPVVFAYGGTADLTNLITGSETITFNMGGFIVDGADRVPGSGHRSAGILLRNVDGLVSTNTVKNMLIDGYETFGIIAQGDSEITIDLNRVSGYARGGIAANGDASSTYVDPVATITNNIVTGPGMGVTVTWAPNGIQIGWGATGSITGNTVTGNGWPGSEWSGTGILVFASDNVTVSGNTASNNETGIAVGGDLWYGTGTADDNVITENAVSGNTYGVSVQSAAADTSITENTITGSTYDGIDVFGTPAPTGTIIEFNNVYGNNTANDPTSGDLWVGSGVATVDASPNWWGSLFGSEAIIGDATIIQWCSVAWDAETDLGCYPLVPDVNGVIEIGPGILTQGIVINQPNLTIRALNGTTIQPTSGACFDINVSNTTIEAATKLGAVCKPPAGENGINVADGLEEVVIMNLAFDGSAGGVDGIHFNGIADLMIIDNWFHNLTGDAIEFMEQPTGVVSIQGNLFQENAGLGINASTFTVPAAYNSWGHVDGAAAGDGASASVDTDPYTHVDLYLGASGVAQVGETITLTVYGNLENVFGATFDFVYPASLELVGTPTNLSAFVPPIGTTVFTVNAGTRTITFNGYMGYDPLAGSNPPVSGVDTPLFSATFNVKSAGGILDLVDTSDEFIMITDTDPAPSTNIYAFALVDGELINTAYTVIGKVSMQGRTVNSGVPVALTGTGVYGPYGVNSIQAVGDNYTFTNVADGEYVFTTNQPRYLNVAEGLYGITVTVDVDENITLSSLVLKGGNANWTNNRIDGGDASVIGTYYGQTIDCDGDVNFDGKVNITDLTLVGGNFLLTSANAYGSWLP